MGIGKNSIVKIEIDGVEFKVQSGSKIIEVADKEGIYIPRFCYHKKLSISANCRMCLVEVERIPKLVPACATSVMDNMKIFTDTKKVIDAQRAVMEFLLINHPLDCPICDQGGECELQDLTIGYGCTTSRYVEEKRIVSDYDLGSLVSTDFTRCILCSRCVRFVDEIAGKNELGIVNRGNSSRIFTFLKERLSSGISGNVIDICPVGALTSKPSKYKIRAWELIQNSFISPHDCIGSNLFVHTGRDKVFRVVPKRNDSINESWISDRDRFSYESLYSEDRLKTPMIKVDGKWVNVTWAEALKFSSEKINNIKSEYGPEQLGLLASPSSTTEEFYLLQKLYRTLGSNNIDHRLRQIDFSMQDQFPIYPGFEININDIGNNDLVFVVGSDLVEDQPIVGIKLRTVLKNNGSVFVLNPVDFDFSMNITKRYISNVNNFTNILSIILKMLVLKKSKDINLFGMEHLIKDISVSDEYNDIVSKFLDIENKVILLGSISSSSPDYSKILSLCILISKITNAKIGVMTEGSNTSGAWLSGFVPHRLPGGKKLSYDNNALNVSDMIANNLKGYVLFGTELMQDSFYGFRSLNAFKNSDFILSFSTYKSNFLDEYADVLLPISHAYENSGTYINVSGLLQSFSSVVPLENNVKKGYEAILELANNLELPGFFYKDSLSVLNEVKSHIPDKINCNWNIIGINSITSSIDSGVIIVPSINQYNGDSMLRRAKSLQNLNSSNNNLVLFCNMDTYNNIKSKDGYVYVLSNGKKIRYEVEVSNFISNDSILVDYSHTENFKNFDLPYKKISLYNE